MSKVAARRWALFFLLIILVGTLMPAAWRDGIIAPFPYGLILQKAGHVVAFAGAAFLALRSAFWRVQTWHVFCLGLSLAVATEVMQMLVRGRSPSTRDLLLDLGGICLGVVLARFTKN